MTDVLYRCATTGQNVQVWFADGVPDDSVYITLRCPACARVHLSAEQGEPSIMVTWFISITKARMEARSRSGLALNSLMDGKIRGATQFRPALR